MEPICFNYGECIALIDSNLATFFNIHKSIQSSVISQRTSIALNHLLDTVSSLITYLLIHTPTYQEQKEYTNTTDDGLPNEKQIKYLQVLKILHDMARFTHHLRFIDDNKIIMKELLDRIKVLQSCCKDIPINLDSVQSMKDSTIFNKRFVKPKKRTVTTHEMIGSNKLDIQKTIEKEIKSALKDLNELGIDNVEVKVENIDNIIGIDDLDVDDLDVDVEIVIEEVEVVNDNDDQDQ